MGIKKMSQAGPNPRSGRIEQNNVLMYSGNLLSNIGAVKEMARLQKEYQDMRAKALLAGEENLSESEAGAVATSAGKETSVQSFTSSAFLKSG